MGAWQYSFADEYVERACLADLDGLPALGSGPLQGGGGGMGGAVCYRAFGSAGDNDYGGGFSNGRVSTLLCRLQRTSCWERQGHSIVTLSTNAFHFSRFKGVNLRT